MRVKIFTFRYSETLGGFDDEPLARFLRDKEVVAFREHFFLVNEVPHFRAPDMRRELLRRFRQRRGRKDQP